MIRIAVLALALGATLAGTASAATQQRLQASAYDIHLVARGHYASDATGGLPGSSMERHQRANFSFAATYPKVFFPAKDVDIFHTTTWSGHHQNVRASYAETGFTEADGQRTDLNCSGPLVTNDRPYVVWSRVRHHFELRFVPIGDLLSRGHCGDPFLLDITQLFWVANFSRHDLSQSSFARTLTPPAPRRAPSVACQTRKLTPHVCSQSGGLRVSITFRRVCTGELVYTRWAPTVYTYRGRCA